MIRMKDERLLKRSDIQKQGGYIGGRPQLRWEDCLKRNLGKAKEEEKWREKANNRHWEKISKVAVHRIDN